MGDNGALRRMMAELEREERGSGNCAQEQERRKEEFVSSPRTRRGGTELGRHRRWLIGAPGSFEPEGVYFFCVILKGREGMRVRVLDLGFGCACSAKMEEGKERVSVCV